MSGAEHADVTRQHVLYSGHVQGVFFRATSVDLARHFHVVGHVRNLPDGRVELEAQGAPQEIELFLAEVAARYEGHIRDVTRTTSPVRGDEGRFEIRY